MYNESFSCFVIACIHSDFWPYAVINVAECSIRVTVLLEYLDLAFAKG